MHTGLGVYYCVSKDRDLRGVPRSAKEANKPNKRATGLKPRTCAHQGQCLGPMTPILVVFVLLKVQFLRL